MKKKGVLVAVILSACFLIGVCALILKEGEQMEEKGLLNQKQSVGMMDFDKTNDADMNYEATSDRAYEKESEMISVTNSNNTNETDLASAYKINSGSNHQIDSEKTDERHSDRTNQMDSDTEDDTNTAMNHKKDNSMEAFVNQNDILSDETDYHKLREITRKYAAGTVLTTDKLSKEAISSLFYYEEIGEDIKSRINGKSYSQDCTVPYEDLRYVRVLHNGFDEETHIGELIVNKAIADDIVEIFLELYEADYKIEKMFLVDEYDADDDKSMAANNTSAFNFRLVAGTNRLSKHSYGLAIDINPLYNPYITKIDGEKVVLPANALAYEDRTIENEYYIHKDDICYEAFIKRGFTWGGDWVNSKDYQHFQKIDAE